MQHIKKEMSEHLKAPSKIGSEISITGKWIPTKKGILFRKSPESREMLKEWEDIHLEAKNHPGMLSTEINHAVGQDAILVHHVFESPESLEAYFSSTATEHAEALMKVAKPDIHVVRGSSIPEASQTAITDKGVPTSFGEFLFGYVDPGNKVESLIVDPLTYILDELPLWEGQLSNQWFEGKQCIPHIV